MRQSRFLTIGIILTVLATMVIGCARPAASPTPTPGPTATGTPTWSINASDYTVISFVVEETRPIVGGFGIPDSTEGPPFRVDPSNVDAGVLVRGQSAKVSLVITNLSNVTIGVSRKGYAWQYPAQGKVPSFEFPTLILEPGQGRTVPITIEIPGDAEVGNYKLSIRFLSEAAQK